MIIYFKTKKLGKKCSSKKERCSAYGHEMASKLEQRLSELQAAECLHHMSKLPAPRFHQLKGNRKGVFSVDLKHPYRLLFIHAHDNESEILKDDGGFDLSRIIEIEIIEITDTHDNKSKRR